MATQFFPDTFQRGVLAKIAQFAREAAHSVDKDRIFISGKAYTDALAEAEFDANFLRDRRGLRNGISEGKLAGVLFYRFSRHRIVHLGHEIVDDPHYEHFQEKVIVKIIGSLLNVNFNDEWIRSKIGNKRPSGLRNNFQNLYGELMYLTCRRHYNQESLALFFDTYVYLSHAIDEIRMLESKLAHS